MAIVVPNVATAEECLELADAACEIVQLWKLRPKSWSTVVWPLRWLAVLISCAEHRCSRKS